MERDSTERVGSAPATGPLNLNPPHFHLLLWPLTAFAPNNAFAIWMALSAVALMASLTLVIRSLRLGGWAIASLLAVSYASPAMFAMVLTGQVGAVLLLPFTLSWNAARKSRAAQSAAWLGLCASVKPLFLLFVPAYLRLGLWRAALVADRHRRRRVRGRHCHLRFRGAPHLGEPPAVGHLGRALHERVAARHDPAKPVAERMAAASHCEHTAARRADLAGRGRHARRCHTLASAAASPTRTGSSF